MSSGLGGASIVQRARHRRVSLPVPYCKQVSRIFCLIVWVKGSFLSPTLTWVHLSKTISGAPLTNILGVPPNLSTFLGTQYVDMDFRSLENSRVHSFFHMAWMLLETTLAASLRPSPVLLQPQGLTFSAKTTRAVSVASPIFSKACLYSLKSMAESLHMIQMVAIS